MQYLLFSFAIIFLLSSCSRIPEPIGYQYSTQEKMQAVHHWNVLSRDLANKINNELIRSDFLDTAVFVKETCGSEAEPCAENTTTDFNEGFRDLLITELVGFGIPTSAVADGEAIRVDYKVQVVYHQAGRIRTVRPGLLTALTTAVSVLRNAPAEIMAISLAAGIDYGNTTYAKTTNLEAIITTSMIFRNKYLFRSSDIYYINSADSHHYKGGRSSKEIQLTSTGESGIWRRN
ncbi:hypothetical protein [Desulfopila inferna]|uniref:hypothetical protein n=1 Tax=Desulfopila inferna TaxID=468528 RepID=UPI00196530A9|nr:hypothetical protein [Desulfopila inferna]MBM9602655.1 hypothetical protein [Desulfopila inferna]